MAGRIPNRVHQVFEEILNSPTGYLKFKRIMAATKDPKHYLAYFQECMDRKFGKSPQFLELDVNESPRPTREQLEAVLKRLGSNQGGAGMAES